MRREGCAEEDDEEKDGGDSESDGQDEGQEGGLCVCGQSMLMSCYDFSGHTTALAPKS